MLDGNDGGEISVEQRPSIGKIDDGEASSGEDRLVGEGNGSRASMGLWVGGLVLDKD